MYRLHRRVLCSSCSLPDRGNRCYNFIMSIRYVHDSHYGNFGAGHSPQAQYMIKGDGVYATAYNKGMPIGKPLYNVRGGKWYATAFHPEGKSEHALYEMRGDKIHTTPFHAEHNAGRHVFEVRAG